MNIDFSTLASGKTKANEVIAEQGLTGAAFLALEAQDSGSSFPEQTAFVAQVKARLAAKRARVEAKHGKN